MLGWPKNQTFKKLLRFLLIATGYFQDDLDFDEGEGGTIGHPTWMSLVHCVRSYFGVHGAIDFNEFATAEINRFVAAIYRTERFSSRQGLDPWVELRKRRRVDLFDGRIETLFPLNPVVPGLSSSDIAFQRVQNFFESLGTARRGRGLDTSRSGNVGVRRSLRAPAPRRSLRDIAPAVFTDRLLAVERRRAAAANGASASRGDVICIVATSAAAQEEMDTSSDVEEGSSSRNVDETSASSSGSSVPREEIGERSSHVSTAEDPIGSPEILDENLAENAANPDDPAESSGEEMDEVDVVGESSEDEPPVTEVLTDDDADNANLSENVTPSSSTVSPEIGSFRLRPGAIVSSGTPSDYDSANFDF